jgi:hypothetical protein
MQCHGNGNNKFYLLFYFSGSGFGMNNWDFLGSTIVTGTHVQLTGNEQSKAGAIWNSKVS